MTRKFKFESLPRGKNVTDRLVAVLLSARFMDELLSGLPEVLMPTIRTHIFWFVSRISQPDLGDVLGLYWGDIVDDGNCLADAR